MKRNSTLAAMLLALGASIPMVAGAAPTATAAVVDSSYAIKMVECLPAPGQFVGSLTVPNKNYGVGENGSLVSLGGFGGYIVLEFAEPIVNDSLHPYGVDFTVQGNSFAADLYGVWTEPGAVMVMKDENHNGLPDDTWYELAGSDYYLSTTKKNATMTYYNPHYIKRHTIPWKVDDGTTGAMRTNQFHAQSYFPGDYAFDCGRDSIAYTGNLIKGCIDLSTPSYIENYRAQLFGYCDNKGAAKNEVHNPYTTTMVKGGDGFDLDWAVDKDGNYVSVDSVKWIKVYTSLNQDGGWLGELSTEVQWAQRVKPDSTYKPRNYYAHYIGIPQLKALVGQPIQYEGLLFKNGRPCNEGTPQWSLSNDTCGTIDQTGKFTPTHGGEVFVRFTQLAKCADKDTIVVAIDSVRLRVVELTGVVLEMEGNASTASNDSTSLYMGEYTYITAQSVDNIGDYLNGSQANRYTYDTYTWKSSDPSIGTIENGLFHADKVGRTMLYAYSNSNPALYDSILVIVNEPQVALKENPFILNYKTNEEEYETYDLFDAGGATISVKSATPYNKKADIEWDADENILYVEFEKNDFGYDTVDFVVHAFNQDFNLTVPFRYYEGDMQPTNKRLFFVNGGVFGSTTKTELLAYDTEEKKTTSIGTVDATSVQDMVVDGAYAYVAADNYIVRFNTTNNEVVATKYCQDTTAWDDGQGKSSYGLNNKMAVYRNWLLVTRQNSGNAPEDGYNVRVYNKTDLSLVKKVPVSDQATDIAIVDSIAYIMINGGYAGTTSSMAVLNLNTLQLEKEIPMNTAGLNVSMLIPKDSLIYCLRRNNYSGVTSAVLTFNVRTQTYTETLTGLAGDYSSAPAAVDPMTGDSLLLATTTGFKAFNTKSGVVATSEVMASPSEGLSPQGSTHDTETGLYYVAYGAWGGNGEGHIYNADFTSAGTFTGVGASPEAMTMGAAVVRNNAPQPKAGKGVPNKFNLDETTTYSQGKSIWPSDFTDTENNIDNIYIKNWVPYTEWLEYDLRRTNSASVTFRFPESLKNNNLDKDSTVHIYAEVIDKYGANYAYEAYTVTLRPAIYAIYPNPIEDITVEKNADTITLSLVNAFTWQTPIKESKTVFVKSIKDNTGADLVQAELDEEDNDKLYLSFAEDTIGVAEITIEETATLQEYSTAPIYTRSATNTFRVTVQSTPTELEDIDSDNNSLVAYPNPFVDHLNVQLAEAATIRIYDISGQCVAQVVGHAGLNTICTAAWTNGVYIVRCGNLSAKVVK